MGNFIEDINQVKANNPLLDVVKRYGVDLKLNGKGHIGLCPFHQEKTASFYVYPENEKYHCYGCGSHGDVIDFVENKEDCNTQEALVKLGGNNLDTNSFNSEEYKKAIDERREVQEKERQQSQEKVKNEANKRYKEATILNSSTGYLKHKGVVAVKGIKYKEGVEIIPMLDIDFKVWNLQRIYKQEGIYTKRFLKDGKTKGLFFPIGIDLSQGFSLIPKVCIAEGIATALSIYQAIKIPTLCVFSSSNIINVVKEIIINHPVLEIIICADNDKWMRDEKTGEVIEKNSNIGLQTAFEVAREYSFDVRYPEFKENLKDKLPSDFNDLHNLIGIEEVKRQFKIVHDINNLPATEVLPASLPASPQVPLLEGCTDRLAGIFPKLLKNELNTKNTKSKAKELTPKQKLMQLLEGNQWEFWHSANDNEEAGITLKKDDYYEHYLVNSQKFRTCLSGLYYKTYKEGVNNSIIDDVLMTIKARGIFDGEKYKVSYRIGKDEKGNIYYNLVNSKHEIVKIASIGWEVIKMPSDIKLISTSNMLEQCRPEKKGDIHLLKEVINYGTDENFILIIAYLSYCLCGNLPYPILNITGEQGSGKSETCKKLVSLIDPNKSLSCSIPEKEGDLCILAKSRIAIYFDNISSIKYDISDWLCKLLTGSGIAKRALYTNDDEHTFSVEAGVIVNGINSVINREDLLDRAISINLLTLKERKPLQELDNKFQELKPKIFSGLLDMLVACLKNRDEVTKNIKDTPRMIDYAIFGSCCEDILKLSKGEFLRIYQSNYNEAIEEKINNDTLVQAIIEIMKDEQEIKLTATELFNKLNTIKDGLYSYTIKSSSWLSRNLNIKIPLLRSEGIIIERQKTEIKRFIVIKKSFGKMPAVPAMPASLSVQPSNNGTCGLAGKLTGKTSVVGKTSSNINFSNDEEVSRETYIGEYGETRKVITI